MALLCLLAVQLAELPRESWFGGDYRTYHDAAARWLSTGSFYWPYQLSGPYAVWSDQVMYPPIILPLLVPFVFLPAFLWWAIPLGFTAAVVCYWRPTLGGWIGVLLCLASPFAVAFIGGGNPCMWAMAAVAAGTIWGWPAALVLFKPTLAPFALIGVLHRSWWFAIAAICLASLAMLPLTLDYLRAMHNITSWPIGGPFYSLSNAPLVAVPLVAWLGSAENRSLRRLRRHHVEGARVV